jgi:hypothetical protein
MGLHRIDCVRFNCGLAAAHPLILVFFLQSAGASGGRRQLRQVQAFYIHHCTSWRQPSHWCAPAALVFAAQITVVFF